MKHLFVIASDRSPRDFGGTFIRLRLLLSLPNLLALPLLRGKLHLVDALRLRQARVEVLHDVLRLEERLHPRRLHGVGALLARLPDIAAPLRNGPGAGLQGLALAIVGLLLLHERGWSLPLTGSHLHLAVFLLKPRAPHQHLSVSVTRFRHLNVARAVLRRRHEIGLQLVVVHLQADRLGFGVTELEQASSGAPLLLQPMVLQLLLHVGLDLSKSLDSLHLADKSLLGIAHDLVVARCKHVHDFRAAFDLRDVEILHDSGAAAIRIPVQLLVPNGKGEWLQLLVVEGLVVDAEEADGRGHERLDELLALLLVVAERRPDPMSHGEEAAVAMHVRTRDLQLVLDVGEHDSEDTAERHVLVVSARVELSG